MARALGFCRSICLGRKSARLTVGVDPSKQHCTVLRDRVVDLGTTKYDADVRKLDFKLVLTYPFKVP